MGDIVDEMFATDADMLSLRPTTMGGEFATAERAMQEGVSLFERGGHFDNSRTGEY